MIEIRIDRGTCFGSGECVLNAPTVFDLDDTGVARILPDAPPLDIETAQRIADNCPSGALHVEERAEAGTQPGKEAS